MATGTVKWFDAAKGYGFITPDEGGGDVFVRPQDAQAVDQDLLHEGQTVTFEPVSTDSGDVAATAITIENG